MPDSSKPEEVEIPPQLRDLMARVGPRWAASGTVAENIALMCDSFAPVLSRAPKGGVSVLRDVAYGKDTRQVLDVYWPDESIAAASRPVIVFVHGGAFVDGHRNKNPEIYANVLYSFARHGIVGVNAEYRLAPAHPYPSATEDVAGAVAWTRANIARFGGDASRVFLMGHSSGGAHVASYAYDRQFHREPGGGIRGVVLVSGRVRADVAPGNPNARKVEAYYGSDSALLDERSPVTRVERDSPPTFIAFAEFENPLIDVHSLELASRIAQLSGKAPRMKYLRGHNHTSIIAQMNTRDDMLGGEIRDFVADVLSGHMK
jgi:acetyl esterase